MSSDGDLSVGECREHCEKEPIAGYFAYRENEKQCRCYTLADKCPDDDQYPNFNAYLIVREGIHAITY